MKCFLRHKTWKFLSLVFLSIILLFLFVAPAALAYMVGDINDDGRVDVQDGTLALSKERDGQNS